MEQVCAQAGILPSEIAYVEAHGTGTVVGDAQELAALEDYYAIEGQRSPDNPLLIGSVKSNMGHCEGCSGLAGMLAITHIAKPCKSHLCSTLLPLKSTAKTLHTLVSRRAMLDLQGW